MTNESISEPMRVQELAERLFALYKEQGDRVFENISSQMATIREEHRARCPEGRNADQSWHNIKGNGLEKFIRQVIECRLSDMRLRVTDGMRLERRQENNLTEEERAIKKKLSVNYGEMGAYLPDADIVVYAGEGNNIRIVAILSCKVTLRERIAQTGYWKKKLASDKETGHIKMFFVTPDEDGDFSKCSVNKTRAIAESDTDGAYVLSANRIQKSEKVKNFPAIFEDIRRLLNGCDNSGR